MANLIIKSSADNLVLQGSDASPAITVGATGTTTFAENATLSGTANNIGTATAGTLSSGITFPAGHVIQTQFYKTATALSTTSTSFVDTAITKAIVTHKLNSKIKVSFFCNMCHPNGGDGFLDFKRAITGGATTNEISGADYGMYNYRANSWNGMHIDYMDEPAQAAGKTITYSLRIKVSSNTLQVGAGTSVLILVLEEIAV